MIVDYFFRDMPVFPFFLTGPWIARLRDVAYRPYFIRHDLTSIQQDTRLRGR
jgi:hypothetical protein